MSTHWSEDVAVTSDRPAPLDLLRLQVKRLLGWVTSRILGPHARAVLTDTDQGRFLVGSADFTVGRKLRHDGAYGLEELARLEELTDDTSEALIVGAHVGSLAIPLSRSVARVVAVEATPTTFELLRTNVFMNQAGNVEIHHVAASDGPGTLDILVSSTNSGGNKRVPKTADRRYDFDRPATVTVPAARLDDMFSDDCFDLILVDIEGSEYFALQGMQRLLSQASTLIVEFVPHHIKHVAGVSFGEFFSVIKPHFDVVTVGGTGQCWSGGEIEANLEAMFEGGIEDDGLVFSRASNGSPG